jgi:hypothetical protein
MTFFLLPSKFCMPCFISAQDSSLSLSLYFPMETSFL